MKYSHRCYGFVNASCCHGLKCATICALGRISGRRRRDEHGVAGRRGVGRRGGQRGGGRRACRATPPPSAARAWEAPRPARGRALVAHALRLHHRARLVSTHSCTTALPPTCTLSPLHSYTCIILSCSNIPLYLTVYLLLRRTFLFNF